MRIQTNTKENALQGLHRAQRSFEKSAQRVTNAFLAQEDTSQGTYVEDQLELNDANAPRSQDSYAKPPAKFYSMADESIQMKLSAFAYRSNLLVIKVNDDLDRSLLDFAKKTE
jgi:hypothetical protein